VTANKPSPQLIGTPITFTATAAGGTPPYEYQWWVWDGVTWSLLENWTGSASVTWTPSRAAADGKIAVRVRSSGQEWIPIKGEAVLPFAITAPAPPAATLISPSYAIITATPTYTWGAVSTATSYLLWVKDSGGTTKIQTWYTAGDVGCGSGSGTCSIAPSVPLASGTYTWWVQTRNAAGDGPLSSALSFTVTSAIPDVRGTYTGSGSIHNDYCTDPLDSGKSFAFNGTVNITSQSGSSFSGTGTFSTAEGSVSLNVTGTVNVAGVVTMTFTLIAPSYGSLTVTGSLVGNSVTLILTGRTYDSYPTTYCNVSGSLTMTR
jgi:hypothetical protein